MWWDGRCLNFPLAALFTSGGGSPLCASLVAKILGNVSIFLGHPNLGILPSANSPLASCTLPAFFTSGCRSMSPSEVSPKKIVPFSVQIPWLIEGCLLRYLNLHMPPSSLLHHGYALIKALWPSVYLCTSEFQLRPSPPRATAGHLHALSVPGVGH